MGLRGFFMTDHSTDLVASEWAALKARAQTVSGPDFLVLPGIELTVDSDEEDEVIEGRIHLLAMVDELLPYPEVFGTQNHSGRLVPLGEAMDAIHRQGGMALAAHPTDGFPIPMFGEMGRWSNENYETALRYPEFLGLEFFNKRTSSDTKTGIDENDKNPFPFVSDPLWDTPWKEGMDRFLRLQRSHLDPLRPLALAGGSDAHGDMNYTLTNQYGLYRIAANNSALGKVFTEVYSPSGLTRDGILGAFRNHALVVSDGPALMLWVDANGDRVPEGPVGGSFQLAPDARLMLSGRTSTEFGYFTAARVIRVSSSGVDTSLIWLGTHHLETTLPAYDLANTRGWVAVIVEVQTSRGYRAVTSPVYLQRRRLVLEGHGPDRATWLAIAGPSGERGSVAFTVGLAVPSEVSVDVYDLAGRRIQTLHEGPLAAGEHAFSWAGDDAAGQPQRNGVYFARVRGGGLSLTRKFSLVR